MPKRHSGFRNPVARSPLLRKGGPHQESRTGQRMRARISTHTLAEEWLEEIDNLREEGDIGEQQLPDSFINWVSLEAGRLSTVPAFATQAP